MLLLSGAAGWLCPGVARLVGVALIVPQAITLFATSGSGPLAIVGLFVLYHIRRVFSTVALIAASLRKPPSAARRP